MRLLVTRPQPDAERTADALRARGHAVIVASLLRMETLDCEIPDEPYGAVVMTSANAVRAIEHHPRLCELTVLPAFTVGDHTAEAAGDVGFREVHSAGGDRNDLADVLRARIGRDRRPVLHLAGEDRAGDLDLAPCAVRLVTTTVYRMVKLLQFPPAAESALAQRQVGGVLHFSRRSAEAYLDCAARSGISERALAPLHYCLSGQVAAPLAAAGAIGIRIASRPDQAAMIELVNASS